MDDQLSKTEELEIVLSDREQKALNAFKNKKELPLHINIAVALYNLFLSGHSCEEIYRVNKKNGHDWTLGHIVDARMRYGWDERRASHQKELFDSVMMRIKQTQAEMIEFVSNYLSAAHMLQGDKIKKFLETGDPGDLGEWAITTPLAYKNAVNLFQMVTGQGDSKGSGGGNTQVNIVANNVQTSAQEKVQGQDFAKLLNMVVDGEVKKDG